MNAQEWTQARRATDVVHLDVAACGRVSDAVLDAEIEHLRAEVGGGYVAEGHAEPVLAAGRAELAAMVGLAGTDVAFTEGAGAAFATLLSAWPLPAGSRVGTATSEYGANARVLQVLAAERGWQLEQLPVDRLGRVSDVPAGLSLATFPQVASQRGIAQPVQQVLASGVPLLLDVAQSLGQLPVPAGCAAYVGTSRKWLCGPRGVGFAVVDPQWEPQLTDPPTLAPTHHDGVRRFDSQEAHIAGRVGLAVAAQQWSPSVMGPVPALGATARQVLVGTGWTVVEPVEEPTGITTLLPPARVDVPAVRAALLADGFLVTAVPASRAADLDGPVLRVSTAAWVEPAQLDALAEALRRRSR